MRIRHLLATIGTLPVSPENSPASGVVGAVLNLAPYQAEAGNEVEIWGWNYDALKGWKAWNDVKIWTSPEWSWARFARWDLRWLAPVCFESLLNSPVDIQHVHVDPNLLFIPGGKYKILHLQTPILNPTPQAYLRLLQRADFIICCSDYIRQQFYNATGFDPQRTMVVYNGADPEKYSAAAGLEMRASWGLSDDDIVILYAGALAPEKGVDFLVEAFSRINNSDGKFHLMIAGSGSFWISPDAKQSNLDYEQELVNSARGLKVEFLGLLPRSLMPAVFCAADIVCVPSMWDDPHPTVVCEAMAAGKPVVAFKSGGIPETIIDGKTGFVIPKGDVDNLRNKLEQLIQNHELRMIMSKLGKDRAMQHFSWKKSARQLLDLYQLLISK